LISETGEKRGTYNREGFPWFPIWWISPQRQRKLQCIKDGNERYNTAEGIELAIAEMELGVGRDMAIETVEQPASPTTKKMKPE